MDAILRARTARLAATPPRSTSEGTRYSVVVVDTEAYALDFKAILGVNAVTHVAALPGLSQSIGGLISFRGGPVVALHALAVLGQPRTSLTERTRAVVLGRERPDFALLVDAVTEVRDIQERALRSPPSTLSDDARTLIVGITQDGIIVLNTDHLFESERTLVRTYLGRSE